MTIITFHFFLLLKMQLNIKYLNGKKKNENDGQDWEFIEQCQELLVGILTKLGKPENRLDRIRR